MRELVEWSHRRPLGAKMGVSRIETEPTQAATRILPMGWIRGTPK